MTDTSVKWYSHAMPGAPLLRNVAGDLIAVLDACLVNGFGTTTVQSLTVASNVATVTFASAHTYQKHQIVEIAGVTGALAAINSQWRVTSVGSLTLTFAAAGIADGTATGTITCKVPPLGWERPFSGTNKAAYRSADVTGTRFYLRVDDTGTGHPTVTGYEAMADIDSGTYGFVSNNSSWSKGASTTSREWFLVGDGRTFYYCVALSGLGAGSGVDGFAFGDFDSWSPVDGFSCLIATGGGSGYNTNIVSTHGYSYSVAARSYTQLPGAVAINRLGAGSTLFGSTYPNPVNNGFCTQAPAMFFEGSNARGSLRGGLECIPYMGPAIGTVIDADFGGYSGLAIVLASGSSTPTAGGGSRGAFNLIGPW